MIFEADLCKFVLSTILKLFENAVKRMFTLALCKTPCVCICVDYICVLLCVVVYVIVIMCLCVCKMMHSLRGRFEVVSLMYV